MLTEHQYRIALCIHIHFLGFKILFLNLTDTPFICFNIKKKLVLGLTLVHIQITPRPFKLKPTLNSHLKCHGALSFYPMELLSERSIAPVFFVTMGFYNFPPKVS